jgi:hypothetical protein
MSIVQKTLIRKYATVAAESITTEIIAELKSYTATMSGDDSGLKNIWEELCVQVQGEESFYWEAYQETVRTSVLGRLEALGYHDLASLWLQTDNGCDWDVENDEADTPLSQRLTAAPCVPYDLNDIATYLVSEYVLRFAENYTNKNIEAYLNGGLHEEEKVDDNDDDAELRERLRALMPRNSMVLDLWNWDIHFEDESFDDISSVVFSDDDDELAKFADILTEDILRWIDENKMDYNQHGWQSPDEFSSWIRQQVFDVLTKWRENVKKEFTR